MDAPNATSQFERLAAYLAGPSTSGGDGDLEAILEKLEYFPAGAAEPSETRNRIALLQAAAKFSDVFQLVSRDAPGVMFFGADISAAGVDATFSHQARLSASGAGLSLRQAFESCVGEGVEYLSQFETASDRLQRGAIEDGLAVLILHHGRSLPRSCDCPRIMTSTGSMRRSCRAAGRCHFPRTFACGARRSGARSRRHSA